MWGKVAGYNRYGVQQHNAPSPTFVLWDSERRQWYWNAGRGGAVPTDVEINPV